MKKMIICGSSGRMGSLICELAQASKEWQLVGEVDLNHPLEKISASADVIIDFTLPEGVAMHLKIAAQRKTPMVIGTTGFNAEQQTQVEQTAKIIPIVFSPNMSVGVNILFKLIEVVAKTNPDSLAAITETHHIHKKDAPSGTAKKMCEIVTNISRKKTKIESVREGEVIGEHTIAFQTPWEVLTLTHKALDRKVFAHGALLAARWLLNKKPGLYSMAEVLNLQ